MKSFMVTLLACIAVIFPAIVAELEIADRRYFRVYTGYGFTGPVIEFSDSVPDLFAYGMGRYTLSFCFTGHWRVFNAPMSFSASCDEIFLGRWRVFNNVNYTGTNEDTYVGVNLCHETSPINAVYGESLRYAGSPYGINDVHYNLYENTYYGGLEFKGKADASSLGDLDMAVSSIIISGQSPWTFYTGLDYTGEGMCVLPTDTTTGENGIVINFRQIPDVRAIGLPNDTIRSVARGCLVERILQ